MTRFQENRSDKHPRLVCCRKAACLLRSGQLSLLLGRQSQRERPDDSKVGSMFKHYVSFISLGAKLCYPAVKSIYRFLDSLERHYSSVTRLSGIVIYIVRLAQTVCIPCHTSQQYSISLAHEFASSVSSVCRPFQEGYSIKARKVMINDFADPTCLARHSAT